MARFRNIHLDIWEDEDEFLKYNDSEKVLFFYLITNKNCTESGVYKISQRNICSTLDWDNEKFNKTIENLEPNVFFDKEKSIVFIKNFLKYNGHVFGNPRLIDRSILSDFNNYPSIIWERFVKVYPKYSDTLKIECENNENTIFNNNINNNIKINTTKDSKKDKDCVKEGGLGGISVWEGMHNEFILVGPSCWENFIGASRSQWIFFLKDILNKEALIATVIASAKNYREYCERLKVSHVIRPQNFISKDHWKTDWKKQLEEEKKTNKNYVESEEEALERLAKQHEVAE